MVEDSINTGFISNQEYESFDAFFSRFYHQLKAPTDYSFFKVREFEAVKVAKDLQCFIDKSSAGERAVLLDYEIKMVKSKAINNTVNHSAKVERYLYDPNQVDWNMMEKLGLKKEVLHDIGALDFLLKGYKTPMLIPIHIELKSLRVSLDARLALRPNVSGTLEPRIYPIKRMPDFKQALWGYRLTKADQFYLSTIGNMGRVVNLVHPISHEVIPSLISRDRLTNDLIVFKVENIKVPDEIKGVTLNDVQKQSLKEGKAVFLENMC